MYHENTLLGCLWCGFRPKIIMSIYFIFLNISMEGLNFIDFTISWLLLFSLPHVQFLIVHCRTLQRIRSKLLTGHPLEVAS